MYIEINISNCGACSGKDSLYLDPEDGQVYNWEPGQGTPMAVWHGRHRLLATYDSCTDAASLTSWLQEDAQQEELERLCDLYRGSEWDGSNHVGRWVPDSTDDADPNTVSIGKALDRAICDGEVLQWSSPSDYMGQAKRDYVRVALGAYSLGQAVQDIVDEAEDQGVLLDYGDTFEELRFMIERADYLNTIEQVRVSELLLAY